MSETLDQPVSQNSKHRLLVESGGQPIRNRRRSQCGPGMAHIWVGCGCGG